MSRISQTEIDNMIVQTRPTNRDLVRRDINQAVSSPSATLIVQVKPYTYSSGARAQLLCLSGTVTCNYRGNRYNIPIEIWLQKDHPNVSPMVFVRPTPDMYVSPQSRDVQPDGTVIIPYLKSWRHPHSDLITLLRAMSEAFSVSPPVYAGSGGAQHSTSYQPSSQPYPSNPQLYPSNPQLYPSPSQPYPSSFPMSASPYPPNAGSYSTPYPSNPTMPMPMPGGVGSGPSYPYSNQQEMDRQAYRNSIVSGVFDKVRRRLDESAQTGNAELSSLKQTEQDLIDGQKKLDQMINDARNQQVQAQNYMINLKTKISEATAQASQNSSKAKQDNSILEDALLLPAPVYKQLLQAYAEEHAIQDLLYYLAEGLRRESIGLDIYLKHVRELSRKQFILRATMHKCRQIANLPIK